MNRIKWYRYKQWYVLIIKLFIEMDKVEMLKSIYEVIETQAPKLFMGSCVLIWNVYENKELFDDDNCLYL